MRFPNITISSGLFFTKALLLALGIHICLACFFTIIIPNHASALRPILISIGGILDPKTINSKSTGSVSNVDLVSVNSVFDRPPTEDKPRNKPSLPKIKNNPQVSAVAMFERSALEKKSALPRADLDMEKISVEPYKPLRLDLK
ncbi:MAG: hypothetical protein HQL26_01685 [Candidatus Omnitrophica bacterium]|nr:hypothetical protein [Candidatus Omnitrophota bacterium]